MFDDRSQAGRVLGRMVARCVHDSPLLILALPRGGVPVGLEVARCLTGDVEFDVFLVRKLGVPHREELAFGAIASGGVRVLNRQVIEEAHLSKQAIEDVTAREQLELTRRQRVYRQERVPLVIGDRYVILVDDGLATGACMTAAVRAVRLQQPRKVLVAVPVASQEAVESLREISDEIICAAIPEPFFAVGYWYRDFDQVTDDEVRSLIAASSTRHNAHRTAGSTGSE